ncbi:MAG: hypothetical protein [Arizlama microvirus]|nr:MAG: hypothetical protein [Arizlama microvirus]
MRFVARFLWRFGRQHIAAGSEVAVDGVRVVDSPKGSINCVILRFIGLGHLISPRGLFHDLSIHVFVRVASNVLGLVRTIGYHVIPLYYLLFRLTCDS